MSEIKNLLVLKISQQIKTFQRFTGGAHSISKYSRRAWCYNGMKNEMVSFGIGRTKKGNQKSKESDSLINCHRSSGPSKSYAADYSYDCQLLVIPASL